MFALEVDISQGLDGLVWVAPAAGGVVEDLIRGEVLINLVEWGVGCVAQAVQIHLHIACWIRGLVSEAIEGCVEILLHLLPLPLALIIFEKVWIAFGVVEEAWSGDGFLAETFGERNGLASNGIGSGIGSGVPPTTPLRPAVHHHGNGGGLRLTAWIARFFV